LNNLNNLDGSSGLGLVDIGVSVYKRKVEEEVPRSIVLKVAQRIAHYILFYIRERPCEWDELKEVPELVKDEFEYTASHSSVVKQAGDG
jgi:hypothetical protein